jgi:hypothetical protein
MKKILTGLFLIFAFLVLSQVPLIFAKSAQQPSRRPRAVTDTPTLLGGATIQNGVINLVQNPTVDWSAVSLPVALGTRLNNVLNLSAIFDVTNTNCRNGSPYYDIGLDTNFDGVTDNFLIIYFGPMPVNSQSCPAGWTDTGNFVANTDLRVNSSNLPGGYYPDSYQHASTLLPNAAITYVRLYVASYSMSDFIQNINVRYLSLNSDQYIYDPTTSPTPTLTNTPTPTITITPTNTVTPTFTPTSTPTSTIAPTNTPIPTSTPFPTPTNTPVPTFTPTPTPTAVPTPPPTQYSLQLTSMCSPNPPVYRVWRVRNIQNYNIPFTWELVGTTQRGSGTALAKADVFFNTNTAITNTVKIYWNKYNTYKAGIGTSCSPTNLHIL